METWYLAGNMISENGIVSITDAAVNSSVTHPIRLKRNALGVDAGNAIVKLITSCSRLRMLDLDQTGLGDTETTNIFQQPSEQPRDGNITLQPIYLDGTGASNTVYHAIATFLQHAACCIKTLYLRNSLVGKGAAALAQGLEQATRLDRVSITSCGLGPEDAIAVMQNLRRNASIKFLDLGQAIATHDQDTRTLGHTIDRRLACRCRPTLSLSLGTTAFSVEGVRQLQEHVRGSDLASFMASSYYRRAPKTAA
jgi:Ran GTPase-activating protein (RanGAP) involved in mRNA processing and transport